MKVEVPNWQKVQDYLSSLPTGAPLPTSSVIGEATGLENMQVRSSVAFLRRKKELEDPKSEDTLRRITEGLVRFRGGKRDLYQEYADRGWAPTEIHWALIFTREIDIDPRYINTTIARERAKSLVLSEEERVNKKAYRMLSKEESADMRRTVVKGTPDIIKGRVRFWLAIEDEIRERAEGLPYNRLEWMKLWSEEFKAPQGQLFDFLKEQDLDGVPQGAQDWGILERFREAKERALAARGDRKLFEAFWDEIKDNDPLLDRLAPCFKAITENLAAKH